MTRRQMLAWTALGGAWLVSSDAAWADKASGEGSKYPDGKALKQAEKDGWVIEYKKADADREGTGLRGPSLVPAESFVSTPADLKATQEKMIEVASQANDFDTKYKVPPAPHWMKKQSKALEEALAEARGETTKDRLTALRRILQNTQKKAKLTKDYDKDLEK